MVLPTSVSVSDISEGKYTKFPEYHILKDASGEKLCDIIWNPNEPIFIRCSAFVALFVRQSQYFQLIPIEDKLQILQDFKGCEITVSHEQLRAHFGDKIKHVFRHLKENHNFFEYLVRNYAHLLTTEKDKVEFIKALNVESDNFFKNAPSFPGLMEVIMKEPELYDAWKRALFELSDDEWYNFKIIPECIDVFLIPHEHRCVSLLAERLQTTENINLVAQCIATLGKFDSGVPVLLKFKEKHPDNKQYHQMVDESIEKGKQKESVPKKVPESTKKASEKESDCTIV
eukprot:Phypoly_transcript_14627.p1 GENE.Phypoly_transcript_14627~~Phypoly_transcript_14627.p1  ORF type:complete len:286 (+),score=38.27 Phypoly_transcript_14627:72-929(+)